MHKCLQGIKFVCFLLLFTITSINAEQKYNDAAALNGIEQAKGVFLIDFKTAKTTAFYMDLIVGTYDGFKLQGVEPEIVVVVIGPTVQFLSQEAKPELAFEYEESFDSIQQSIKALAKRDVRIEICAIATDVFNVDNDKLPQELDVVADGFISLIGWQTQGYKLVPVF
ncbi:DsrE family protein [Neptuniibacter sp. PT34_22]|uniref:DsrE family protein n=1 Tax=Neptuniibacter sp. PT34_22 TaxID=3398205 RepID=UPI0039F59C76